MRKTVSETTAGRAIGAYVVLRPDNSVCATVQVCYATSTLLATVTQYDDRARANTAAALGYGFDAYTHHITSAPKGKSRDIGKPLYEVLGIQTASAGGCGYDKKTAALAGMVIDGHHLTNHCQTKKPLPDGQLVWRESDRKALESEGYRFANYTRITDQEAERFAHFGQAIGVEGYRDAYRLSGLDYLVSIGYRVIQAI
jgi:hypothetical protein